MERKKSEKFLRDFVKLWYNKANQAGKEMRKVKLPGPFERGRENG